MQASTDSRRIQGARGASVHLENLSKRFGSVVAVDNISLDIRKGEFITLLGPSGSGKTTTLMMIAGFIDPTAGEILIGGDIATEIPAHLRNIGVVFQNYALFPHLDVLSNVTYPLKMRSIGKGERERRAAEILELVQMPSTEYGDRFPRQLSGGQQQRVALARALIFNPLVLLMDEPLGALDRKLREDMQLEIRRIHSKTGMTTIYVTHDQEEALILSDRIAVMNKGKILQTASPSDLYEHPEDAFVAGFVGESNVFYGRVTEVTPTIATFSTDDGIAIRALPKEGLGLGSKQILIVRPEKFTLKAQSSTSNRLEGEVEEVAYLGDLTRYEVMLGDRKLIVKMQNRAGSDTFMPGSSITLFWEPQDTGIVMNDLSSSD